MADGIDSVAGLVGWPSRALSDGTGREYDWISPQFALPNDLRARFTVRALNDRVGSSAYGAVRLQISSWDRALAGPGGLVGYGSGLTLTQWANVCGGFTSRPGKSATQGSEPNASSWMGSVPWVPDGAGQCFWAMADLRPGEWLTHTTFRDVWQPALIDRTMAYCACRNGVVMTDTAPEHALALLPMSLQAAGRNALGNIPRDLFPSPIPGYGANNPLDAPALLGWANSLAPGSRWGIQAQLYDAFFRCDDRPLDYVESIVVILNDQQVPLQFVSYGHQDWGWDPILESASSSSWLGGLKLLLPGSLAGGTRSYVK